MTKDDSIYIKHIRKAISKIEKYTLNKSHDKFIKNDLMQDGVIRQLEIIDEATKKLSDKFRDEYSFVPWKDTAGTRDKLIHDYFGVDLEAVWDTVQKDIPLLRDNLEIIIRKEK